MTGSSLYDTSVGWTHYLTRPFTLFGASLWHAWYDSPDTEEVLGCRMPRALFVEVHPDVMRQYRPENELAAFKHRVESIITSNPEQCLAILEEGERLNTEAEAHLKRGPEAFPTLTESVTFLIRLALHATIGPYWAVLYAERAPRLGDRMRELGERLRGISYYPRVFAEIVTPLAARELARRGMTSSASAVPLLTYSEIRAGATDGIAERTAARAQGARFVYQVLSGQESVALTTETAPLVLSLEHIEAPVREEVSLKGQTAYPGHVRGTARVVLTPDGKGARFDKGDVLVSINSNPNLMHLIRKSAAMVADEGGITSHAAIVSRELKIPCVIGTKIATQVLKDGDEVEVDAEKGVVRKLS